MKIDVTVSINDFLPISELKLQLPDDMITIHCVEQLISDFVADRLIKAGYPKLQRVDYDGTSKI